MSGYLNFDHTGWMQGHIDSCRRSGHKMHPSTPEKLTEFQRTVTDIMGIVGGGIYNAPINPDKIDWDYGHGVSVIWKNHCFSSFDFDNLTWLLFLCHEARIRCAISAAGPRNLRLSFWQRKHEGGLAIRHPNLAEAVASFRQSFREDHRIIYSMPCPEDKGARENVLVCK